MDRDTKAKSTILAKWVKGSATLDETTKTIELDILTWMWNEAVSTIIVDDENVELVRTENGLDYRHR